MAKRRILKRAILIVALASCLLIVLPLLYINSYRPITCTVVDAETGKPIVGAVVMVGWSRGKGLPGLTYTTTIKIDETVSDKKGRVRIPGIISLFSDPPYLTVYKKDYVAWSNEYIFPDWERRKDFKWQPGYVFELEEFKPEYTHEKWEEIKAWEEIRQKK
jgi:hypothetical protein